MYIILRKKGKKIFFEEETRSIEKEKLNVTNVWNFKEILFEEKKLQEPFIQIFLKELFIKEKIAIVQIEQVKMLPLVCDILYEIPTIKEVILPENVPLSAIYYTSIAKLRYVEILYCYQMESSLFQKCIQNLTCSIQETKLQFIKSNFMIANELNTHSKIFYKKEITFYDTYGYDDFIEFSFFLEENKGLEKINFYGTNVDVFTQMLLAIFKAKKNNISIQILQRKEEQEDLQHIINIVYKKYKKKLRKNHIRLKIKYTREYQQKNILKQLNLNLFRLSVFILFLLTISIYGISKYHVYQSEVEAESLEKIKKDTTANEIVDTKVEEPKKEPTPPLETPKEETPPKKETPKKQEAYTKDMANLEKINNEFTGWLTVNNTSISYPVVKHSDNEYYLKHGFNKKYNINGWIFMDYRNHTETFDQNTIIYGHDSNYSIMFGDLKKVLQKNWYTNAKNQVITYETKSKKWEAEIFSIYVIDNTTDYLQVVFSEEEFNAFLKMITERSIYNFNKNVSIQDKIITLSTCYKDSSKRLVVHARIK